MFSRTYLSCSADLGLTHLVIVCRYAYNNLPPNLASVKIHQPATHYLWHKSIHPAPNMLEWSAQDFYSYTAVCTFIDTLPATQTWLTLLNDSFSIYCWPYVGCFLWGNTVVILAPLYGGLGISRELLPGVPINIQLRNKYLEVLAQTWFVYDAPCTTAITAAVCFDDCSYSSASECVDAVLGSSLTSETANMVRVKGYHLISGEWWIVSAGSCERLVRYRNQGFFSGNPVKYVIISRNTHANRECFDFQFRSHGCHKPTEVGLEFEDFGPNPPVINYSASEVDYSDRCSVL